MLDTIFRNGGERKQAHDELRALLVQARSERQAMRSMLDQVGSATEKLAQTGQAIDALGARTDGVAQKVEHLSALAGTLDERTRGVAQLEARVAELLGQLAEAR
ncbi:MAG: hypothetical protein KJ023_23335, partial [Burkholderiaceae bacterium]|nr:hypothetical protein [Burkholderiaceae bacterium]